jgi:hypothetical protein
MSGVKTIRDTKATRHKYKFYSFGEPNQTPGRDGTKSTAWICERVELDKFVLGVQLGALFHLIKIIGNVFLFLPPTRTVSHQSERSETYVSWYSVQSARAFGPF